MSKAFLKNYRQSPRKVRLVADLVRGKDVNTALTTLSFAPKRAAEVVKKIIESAIANATHNDNADVNTLFISSITVDEGPTIKRFRARARGSAARIRKRTSHIAVSLGSKTMEKKTKVKAEVKTETKPKAKPKTNTKK